MQVTLTCTLTTINMTTLFLSNLRGWEWIIILVVILLLFGGKKIPELMRSMGKGVKSFKAGLNDAVDEIDDKPKSDYKPKSDDKK